MLDRLLQIEERLARVEAMLLVFFVLLMLGLATYNVFYRNVLVPIQVDLLEPEEVSTRVDDGEPTVDGAPEPTDAEESGGFGGGFEEDKDDLDDGAAGFGGGFGEDEEPDDPAAGFGGGFDDGPDEPDEPDETDETDDAAGFGGDFGEPEETEEAEDDGAGGFGGGFGAPAPESSDTSDSSGPSVDLPPVPEAEEPFLAKLIDWIKLEWIDVLLRQLVLIVGFLGAMLATRRRKHITIDALSRLIPERFLHWMHVLTNLISIVVCTLLAIAGADLVGIGLEYRKELVSWAEEWQFQLVFPVGFGLLVLHFSIRFVESIYYALGKAEPTELAESEGVQI